MKILDKIAELFYPQELKETIADLRAKDDLNKEALARLNNYIKKRLKNALIICFVFSLFLINPYVTWHWWFFLLFIFLPFLIISLGHEAKELIKKLIKPYNYGQIYVGECVTLARGYRWADCLIEVDFEFNKLKKRASLNTAISIKDSQGLPTVGQKTQVCYLENYSTEAVPFIKPFSDIFYLRKEKHQPHEKNIMNMKPFRDGIRM